MIRIFLISILIPFITYGYSQITVAFDASATEGCGTLQVNFTDRSTSSAGSITDWAWDLGGSNASIQNPAKIFSESGNFTICLTVTDNAGNINTLCKEELIHVFPLPNVDFNAIPAQGCIPLEVNFETNSSSPNGALVELIWGLGGSAGVISSSDPNEEITATYSNVDQYTISLIVEDEQGCINSLTRENFIQTNGVPEILLSISDTFNCEAPFLVSFDHINPSAGIEYVWDFGDGSTFVGPQPPPKSYEVGLFSVQVVGTDISSGCKDTLFLENVINVGNIPAFEVSNQSGCTSTEFTFLDISAGTPEQILWDFGDGNTSSALNPTHIYESTGCYTVMMTKTVDGCTNSIMADYCIDINETPSGSFDNSGSISCTIPFDVNFFGNANSQVAYFWEFGLNGILGNSEEQNPSFTFDQIGRFPVSMYLIEGGCRVLAHSDTIEIFDFQASLPLNVGGCLPLTIRLSDNIDEQVVITDYEWTIFTTPPIISTDPNPLVSIVDSGYYDVQLIVENALGCRDTIYRTNHIGAGERSTVDFEADPLLVCVGNSVQFTNLSTGIVGSYLWDFGDGETSVALNPSHTYLDTGYFNITLNSFHYGCRSVDSILNYIHVVPPQSDFDFEHLCDANGSVQFINDSYGYDSLVWKFGIDSIYFDSTEVIDPIYAFQNSGKYTVSLTTFNSRTGCMHEVTDTVFVYKVSGNISISNDSLCLPDSLVLMGAFDQASFSEWVHPAALFENRNDSITKITFNEAGRYYDIQWIIGDLNGCRDTITLADTLIVNQILPDFFSVPDTLCPGEVLSLMDNSKDSFGIINAWTWDIGGIANSDLQHPTVRIDSVRYYDIELRVTDDFGCEASIIKEDIVLVSRPLPLFEFDTLSCTGATITFSNNSPESNLTFLWDFGDGNTSTETEPSHSYSEEGAFEVCLTATRRNGCDSMICIPNAINITNPIANFAIDNNYANCPPLIVNFENLSSNALAYTWDFGDESGVSDLNNPAHVYNQPGSFSVTLIAELNPQCKDSIVFDNLIRLDGPEGDFDLEIDASCAPVNVTFRGNSIDQYNYFWDFGDGIIDTSASQVFMDTVYHSYTIPGTYNPVLILVDTLNCQRSFRSDHEIEVFDLNIDIAVLDEEICGAPAQFNVINNTTFSDTLFTFEWDFDGLEVMDSVNLLLQANTAANYQLVYSGVLIKDSISCESKDTISVRIFNNPEFRIPDTSNCYGVPTQLNASIQNDLEFQWATGNYDLDCYTCPSPIVQSDSSIQLFYTLTDSNSCTALDTLNLSIFDDRRDLLGIDRSICLGDTIHFNIANAANASWRSNVFLDCDTCVNVVASPLDSSLFFVTIQSENNCPIADSVYVAVIAPGNLDGGEDWEICKGESIFLQPEFFGALTWSPSFLFSDSTLAIQTLQLDSSQTLIITARQDACELKDSIHVVVIQDIEFEMIGDTICPGEEASITISGNGATYNLLDVENYEYNTSADTSIIFQPTAAGNYQVVGYDGLCPADTNTVYVGIHEIFEMSLPPSVAIYPYENDVIPLEVFGSSVYNYLWTPSNGLNCATCKNPIIEIDSSNTFNVTVTDALTGCYLQDSIELQLLFNCGGKRVFMPNAFSPNGDGKNDIFKVFSADLVSIEFLRIYDRWGSKVFDTQNMEEGWDGTFKGELMNPGVFVVAMKAICELDGKEIEVWGDVTLVR